MERKLDEGGRIRPGRTIMVQGTASDVGKSLVTAALCRLFTQDGWQTAPFKSQNMSNNSYVTWDGKEIGRAQGMQADACGVQATTDMNPILLKPTKEMSSQVVVHGKPLREYEAREYRESYLPTAGGIARDALGRLREAFDIVVLEGAGSPAEINLKDRDIVNMRMAAWADAPVILVADIDRGGVFASIVGTIELLEPEERDRIRGVIINKFRGDVSLLRPGLDWLEERTGKPVIGVLPWLPGLELEAEDSLSLERGIEPDIAESTSMGNCDLRTSGRLDIAIVRLPRIANFTDADPLRFEEDVTIRFVEKPSQWGAPDAVIIPGSKNTLEDLAWLRTQGLAELFLQHVESGGWAAGLCGGYEMLGKKLLDPLHTESELEKAEGLGVFPFEVIFTEEKRTLRVEGCGSLLDPPLAMPVEGYEIHMGRVKWLEPAGRRPFQIRMKLADQAEPLSDEGAMTPDGRVWGTFIHGIMHNDDLRRQWLNAIRGSKGWNPLPAKLRFRARREEAFDRLAACARAHLNVPLIYQMLKEG